MTSPNPAWKRIDSFSGQNPKPRHGHRGIAVKDLIIIFGGGNEGIVDDLNVFNCANNQWFQPPTKGDIPTGCAAFGFATDGTKVLVFGGMVEYGKYSSELMELNPAKWEWKKLKPRASRNSTVPCARLGHSLTFADGKYYLFGGLANDSKDPKQNIPRYLNDLYSLECKTSSSMWDQPVARGTPPIARESHTCIYHLGQLDCRPKLIIYGGMNGNRLGDLWCFYLDFSQWTQITPSGIIPQPRSLHTSVVLGHRMFVFGGWVPLVSSEDRFTNEKEWKCTNTLSAYNLESNSWELLGQECLDENVPRARAGHCAVSVNTRMYIWSGRDGYRKAWNNQVCCKDLWCLETEYPSEPEKVQLLRAGVDNLEVCWNSVPAADSYILQIQRFDLSSEQAGSNPLYTVKNPQSVTNLVNTPFIPSFSNEQQPPSASASGISDSDAVVEQCLLPPVMNKSSEGAPVSNSSHSLVSSISTINAQALPISAVSSQMMTNPMNSTSNSSVVFQIPTVSISSNSVSMPTSITMTSLPSSQQSTSASSITFSNPTNLRLTSANTFTPLSTGVSHPIVRPGTNIQFINTSSTGVSPRPIIFQKTSTQQQPQLLTVVPGGVRLQHLTPTNFTPVRTTAISQPTTIVRLLPPTRPQQSQVIHLNTISSNQKPLVIKAITTPTNSATTTVQQTPVNIQHQQPLLLTTTQNRAVTAGNKIIMTNNNNTGQLSSSNQVFILNQAPNMNKYSNVTFSSSPNITLPINSFDMNIGTITNNSNEGATISNSTTLENGTQEEIPADIVQLLGIQSTTTGNLKQSASETDSHNIDHLSQLDGSNGHCVNNNTEHNYCSTSKTTSIDKILSSIQSCIMNKHEKLNLMAIPQLDGIFDSVDEHIAQNGTDQSESIYQNSSFVNAHGMHIVSQHPTLTQSGDGFHHQQHTDHGTAVSNTLSVPVSTNIVLNSNENTSTNKLEQNSWHLVGTFKTISANITHYYVVPPNIDLDTHDMENIEANNLVKRVELEPGAIYKLRVAAINACGRGPFSDPSAFKTCLPGSPPAPSNIKISKTLDGGAHLTWDPPQNSSSMITGYAVYLAVKNPKDANVSAATQKQTQMAFVRVYSGTNPDCSVPPQQLLTAHIDLSSSSKPAIIFRIAARNEKGYGPATQVRWLQDQKDTSSTLNNLSSPSLSATSGQVNNFNHLTVAPTTSQSMVGVSSSKRTSSSSSQSNGTKKLRGGDT